MRTNSKKISLKALGMILSFLLIFSGFQKSIVSADSGISNNADLKSVTINEAKLDIVYPDVLTYSMNIITNVTIDNLSVTAEASNNKASVAIEGTEVKNNIAIVKITVTSEDRSNTKIYYVIVRINGDDSPSSDANLLSITINGQKINVTNPYTDNYNIDLPINTAGEYLSVETEASDRKAVVSVEGTRVINNSALVKITVTSENKTNKRVYYVNVQLKEGDANNGFIKIKTAAYHTLALKNDGTLYSFGENNFGQLGDDTKVLRTGPIQVKKITNVVDFDTSNSHSIAVTGDGSVWVWGLNDFGQLSNNKKDILAPIKVEGLYDIVKVRAGNRFSLALDKYGHVWFWGDNSKEQFEEDEYISSAEPVLVSGLLSTKVVDIAVGDYHCLALSDEGKVYAWGANDFGQLGDGTLYNRNIPSVIKDLKKVRYISANFNTSSAIAEDGSGYYWGEVIFDDEGIMNESVAVTIPELIREVSEAQSIEVNNNHIVYVNKKGIVYSKGINKYGQLGDGTTYNKDNFSWVYKLNRVNDIAISEQGSFFIDEKGYIYASGRNDRGQLGLNQTGGNYTTPTKLESFGTNTVEAVYANYKSGEVDKGTVIRLGTNTGNAKIYYTLDGTNPTERSTLYRTPIIINEYTVIKAVAVKDGKYSSISAFEYVISNKARTEMNITIGSKEGKIGDYVEIPITLSNVPTEGISNLKFAIKFNPEILSVQSINYGGLISDSSDFSYTRPSKDTILLSFYDGSRTNRNIKQSGTFATIKLYIKYGINPGRYSLEQVFNSEDGTYSKGYKIVNVYYNPGYIDAVSLSSIMYGDVDGDGKVTALDLQYIQRYIAKKVTSFPYHNGLEAADIDKDGDVDSNDVELIKKIIFSSK